MREVTMKVNQANLVKSLKFSFTNTSTVLGELMQNARRAKAALVSFDFSVIDEESVLTVIDDGIGIETLTPLLTVAESGWDAETMALEHPFGIGFLSALFACRHITVISKGGILNTSTQSILSFMPVAIAPMVNWDGVTVIKLSGIKLSENEVKCKLIELARGFPIPVLFNGECLRRNRALTSDSLNFVQTDIGWVHVEGLNEPENYSEGVDVYLQGLPIYKSRYEANHVIHLDSSLFFARLPDRDKLVDEDKVVYRIKQTVRQLMTEHLSGLKQRLPPNEFVNFYRKLKQWGALSLLNDVPVVPRYVLNKVTECPNCNETYYGDFLSVIDGHLTQAQIENNRVFIVDTEVQYEGAVEYLFVQALDGLVFEMNSLDKDHWLLPRVQRLGKPNIEFIGETHSAVFSGQWVTVGATFCDLYTITIDDETVEITGDAVYLGQDREDYVVVPRKDSTGFVLSQISSYYDEFDTFQEGLYEADRYAFEQFTVANTTSVPEEAFKRLLSDFTSCPPLFGKSFNITLDDNGRVLSVQAA